MLFNEAADITQFDLVNSRTYPMKFKDFQAPALLSSTFKALNLGEKNSSTFKDAWEPCYYWLFWPVCQKTSVCWHPQLRTGFCWSKFVLPASNC